jgi:hypothetical protein
LPAEEHLWGFLEFCIEDGDQQFRAGKDGLGIAAPNSGLASQAIV